MFNLTKKIKKSLVFILTLLILGNSGVLVVPEEANAASCPIVKPGEYFARKSVNPAVFFIDPLLPSQIVFYGIKKNVLKQGKHVIMLNAKCFNKIYPKQATIDFHVATYNSNAYKSEHGYYVVMYTYELVSTSDPKYNDTGTAYKVIGYTIKKTDETDAVYVTKYSKVFENTAIFTIPTDNVVDFSAFKTYNDALSDALSKIGTLTTFGYPYKNFGYVHDQLWRTEYRDPDRWMKLLSPPLYPVGAEGLSIPAK